MKTCLLLSSLLLAVECGRQRHRYSSKSCSSYNSWSRSSCSSKSRQEKNIYLQSIKKHRPQRVIDIGIKGFKLPDSDLYKVDKHQKLVHIKNKHRVTAKGKSKSNKGGKRKSPLGKKGGHPKAKKTKRLQQLSNSSSSSSRNRSYSLSISFSEYEDAQLRANKRPALVYHRRHFSRHKNGRASSRCKNC